MANEYENDECELMLEKIGFQLRVAKAARVIIDDGTGDYRDNVNAHTDACINALHGLHDLLIRVTDDLENFVR